MSSLITICPSCGRDLNSVSGADPGCPQCASLATPLTPEPNALPIPPPWGLLTACLTWLGSVGLTLMVPTIAVVIYIFFDRAAMSSMRGKQFTLTTGLIFIGGTLLAHVLILALCWGVVTGLGQRQFLATLGWGWHPRFKWYHALALAIVMLAIGVALEQVLPHRETDMDELLKLGLPMRVGIAFLAVVTAPLVEEVIYRGILYSALERATGRGASVIVVALLFGAVHVPQYWGSVAVIVAVMLLSLALTLLRAATGKLLPCVATHLIFNGIQAVVIIFQAPKPPIAEPVKVATRMAWHLLGGG